jgi:N-acetylglucosaminyldiphosphoundecaprenol N-acetyl-beta-D-mannosaminyltransferase
MASIQTNTDFRKHVLSFPVDLVNQAKALSIIEERWHSNADLHVITLNAEMIMAAQKDKKLGNIIRESNLVIPDGAGIVFSLKLKGYNTARLPGIELARSVLQLAASEGISVALVGGSLEVLNYLSHALPREIPGLKLVFCQDGYFDSNEENAIMNNINDLHAQLVLVAMGIPRQEYFIEQALKTTKHTVFIGVGGSFDVWAGKKTRAPQIWQACHLEWLYRLINEPWRFKRMGSTLPGFAFQVMVEFLQSKLIPNKKEK